MSPMARVNADIAAAKAIGDPLRVMIAAFEAVGIGMEGMMTIVQDHEARIALLEASAKP
jgi:hypothetical protein